MTKVVIIDSGLNANFPVFNGKKIKQYNYVNNEWHLAECDDMVGHGTAVGSIICSNELNNIEYYIFNIFGNENAVSDDLLISALRCCQKYINPDLIHLSIGTIQIDAKTKIDKQINKAHKNKIIVISAFSNSGYISYPAANPKVIGVDFSNKCVKASDFIFVHNSPVNILATGISKLLPFKNGKYANLSGASFAAAYVTNEIVKYIDGGKKKHVQILKHFEKIAKQKIIFPIPKKELPFDIKNIKNAITFPLNKEITTLFDFEQLLKFKIIDAFDDIASGNVNKPLKANTNCVIKQNRMVKDYKQINWSSALFDTVILGHVKELSNIRGKQFLDFFIKKCKQYNKFLYTFDNPKNKISKKSCFTPQVSDKSIINAFGKLHYISKPLLCVCGTYSRQGKNTLRLLLEKELISLNYKIGSVATEPNGYLLNDDFVFPLGYAKDSTLTPEQCGFIFNQMLSRVNEKNPDIITFSTQSNTVPYNFGNFNFLNSEIYHILFSVKPDAFFLCVDKFDDLDYIKRTVNFITSITEARVLGIFISNFSDHKITYTNNQKSKNLITKKLVENVLKIKAFNFCATDIKRAIGEIVKYFG